jgi:hypothetical protein
VEGLKILAFSLQDRPRVSLQAVPQQVVSKLRESVTRRVYLWVVLLYGKHPLHGADFQKPNYDILTACMVQLIIVELLLLVAARKEIFWPAVQTATACRGVVVYEKLEFRPYTVGEDESWLLPT